MGVDNSSSVASNGITREQFLSTLKNQNEKVKNKAIEIFDYYAKSKKDDNILDETEQKLAIPELAKIEIDLANSIKQIKDAVVSKFFQYVTQDNDFDGTLANGNKMELPAGCTQTNDGIEFNGDLYVMRGGEENDLLRFECDKTRKTLRQALSEAKSDDAVHKYHNHGDAVNDKSTYDKESGTISHDDDETAVSQTQTFASMLMNGAKDSRLTLDEQKGKNGNTTTTGETILNTINTDKDDGITMKELMSYLNAVQQESQNVQNPTGARKFAKGVDLDAKDLSNISKVFKKYARGDNKLQANELQQLLDDLKTKSMSDLARGDDDKYIGKNNKPEKPTPESTSGTKKKPVENNGNRTRKVRQDVKTEGYGKKQKYDYHDGVRTALVEEEDGKRYEDENGNLAQVGHSSLFKKRFEYIEGLPKKVNAKVIDGKIEGSEGNPKIVQVKDKDKNVTYYRVNTTDNDKYQLGEQLIKTNDKFIPKSQEQQEINKQLGLPPNTKYPNGFTAEFDNEGNIKFKYKGKDFDKNMAIAKIRRKNGLGSGNTFYLTSEKLKKSERQKMEDQAKKEDYTPTDSAKYGWYTKKVDGQVRYFKWNPDKGTFKIQNNVIRVNKKGKYETK